MTAVTPDQEARRQVISAELARIEERSMVSAHAQMEEARAWRAMNVWLGVPTTAAGAIGGMLVLALEKYDAIGGALAMAAAAGSAVLMTAGATHRASRAAAAGNAYMAIQTTARQTRILDLPWSRDVEVDRQVLGSLCGMLDEQDKAVEPASDRSHRRGRRTIRKRVRALTAANANPDPLPAAPAGAKERVAAARAARQRSNDA